MAKLTVKRAPAVASNERAWSQVYDDINDIIKSVNKESTDENRTKGMDGLDGDIRLFKDNVKSKYFIEGKFKDGWAKRELLFSDSNDATQDESINFSATESYVKPDGTVPFTAVVSGVSPSADAHLATKAYVDTNVNAIQLTGNVTGGSGAVTISTTIATNAIAKSMMQDNSVGTDEILNSNVTYAKLQNVSATKKVLGRISSGSGVVEEITPTQLADIVSDADSSDGSNNLYLAASGIFREISAAVSVAGISDTVIQSVADNHFLYYDYNSVSDTGFWKNRLLVASDIPSINISSGTSGTLPVNRGGTGATSGYNSSNWNTAYGWGDHGAAGYMSSFIITETDLGTSTVNHGKYVKFASSNSGSHGNSYVNGSGTSGDPFVVNLNTPDTNTNQLTTFTLTADSGSNQTIAHGNTLDIEGGSGISTSVGSTDKVTITATGNLPTLAGLSAGSGNFIVGNGSVFTVQSGSTARTSLGLGSAAVANTSAFLAHDTTTRDTWTVSGDLTGNDLYVTTGYFRTNSSNGMQVLTNGGSASGTQSKWLYLDDTYINPSSMATGEIRCSKGRIGSSVGIPSSGKFIVGGVCDSTSSAVAQFAGFVRMRDYVIIHDGSSSSNAVGWQYENGGLQTWASGTGTENVYAGADVVAYYSSDPDLKKNKQVISKPFAKLNKIRGYTFDWKKKAKKLGKHLEGKDYGVMANEIEEVMPELVEKRDNGYRAVKYEKIIPLLIECIKEQQKDITRLKRTRNKWI